MITERFVIDKSDLLTFSLCSEVAPPRVLKRSTIFYIEQVETLFYDLVFHLLSNLRLT